MRLQAVMMDCQCKGCAHLCNTSRHQTFPELQYADVQSNSCNLNMHCAMTTADHAEVLVTELLSSRHSSFMNSVLCTCLLACLQLLITMLNIKVDGVLNAR